MTQFTPTRPDHLRRVPQAVAMSIAAVAAGALWIALGAVSDLRGEIADIEALDARVAALPAEGPSDADRSLHAAETPQLAQAQVQAAVQALAETHAAEIDVIRAEDIVEVDGFARLNLTLGGTVPERALGAFLAGLDALEPAVLTEELTLRRTRTARGEADRRVAFQMRVHGLARP